MSDVITGCIILGIVLILIASLVTWSIFIINKLQRGGEKTVREIVKAGKNVK